MNRYSFSVLFTVFFMLLGLGLTGCGGGGGSPSGPGSSSPNSIVKDGSEVLADDAQTLDSNTTARSIYVDVPATNTPASFALVIGNLASVKQDVQIIPQSYRMSVFSDVKSISRSVRKRQPTERDLIRLRTEKLRHNLNRANRAYEMSRILTQGLRPSSKVNDNSNEQEGDIVTMNIISNTRGSQYSERSFRLKKISDSGRLKIFVDTEAYNGYDPNSGTYRVKQSDIDHFADEFDEHIYPLLTESYGEVYDIDNDGALSLVISPIYAAFGYAGLFNSAHMEPDNPNSNMRDMIAVWSPSKGWTGDKWLEATRETIAHEMQHIVNYSARRYRNDTYDKTARMEEVWLDEGLAVAVEARYRLMRGDPVRENRFDSWAEKPSSVGMTDGFGYTFDGLIFQKYGMNGLFNYYLWEQGGNDAIKALVQNELRGIDNINSVFSSRGGMNGMFSDWKMAAMIEGLRNDGIVDISKIDDKLRYSDESDFQLPLDYSILKFGQSTEEVSLRSYGVAFYLLTQPENFNSDNGANTYRFLISSDPELPLSVRLMRIPAPE